MRLQQEKNSYKLVVARIDNSVRLPEFYNLRDVGRIRYIEILVQVGGNMPTI
jgi:hypothetical protein